jgi:hypothetical protein
MGRQLQTRLGYSNVLPLLERSVGPCTPFNHRCVQTCCFKDNVLVLMVLMVLMVLYNTYVHVSHCGSSTQTLRSLTPSAELTWKHNFRATQCLSILRGRSKLTADR